MSLPTPAQQIARNSLRRLKGSPFAQDTRPLLQADIQRGYSGNWQAYTDAVSVLSDDQRQRFERAGVVLRPKQALFAHAARLADTAPNPSEIAIGGARGGGKSHIVLGQAGIDDCQRMPGLKALYLRRTAKASKEQLTDLFHKLLAKVECEITATQVRFPNGSRIIVGGFKDDSQAVSYQGLEYSLLIIEELTQLHESTYKTLRLSLRTSNEKWRPRVYTSFNPLGIGHMWTKKRFIDPYRENRQDHTFFIPSTVDDNPFVNAEYVGNLEELTGAELQAYRYGNWDVAAGAYFDTWDYDTHVIPPFEKIPSHWRVWAAMDAGYSHWNITQFFTEDSDGNVYVFHELAHRKAHPDSIAPDIHAALIAYGLNAHHLPPISVGTDAFRLTAGQNTTLADQYRVYNIAMQPADMSPGSRIAGARAVSKALGNPREGKRGNLYITRNCQRLIESMPYAERDPKNPEDIKKWDTDDNGAGGDDSLDCLRYGLIAGLTAGGSEGHVAHATYRTFDGVY